MKSIYYRQCQLVKKEGVSTLNQVSWIPEKFAIMGKVLKLKEGETWDDHWIVSSVGGTRRLEEHLPDSHKAIKGHRKNTGDSLPKEKRPH